MNTLSYNNTTIISKKEIPNVMTVILNSDNIVEVKWEDNLAEIEKKHLIMLKEIVRELGKGKKMLVYMYSTNFTSITSEARIYASTKEAGEFTMANAILVDSLSKKLLFNFFMKINTSPIQTKGFNSPESAMNWLKEWQF